MHNFLRSSTLLFLLVTFLLPFTAMAQDTVTQFAVMESLLQGHYDGMWRFKEMTQHGNWGLGTVAKLDGEVIGTNGVFYQITADGKVHKITDHMTAPTMILTFFNADTRMHLNHTASRADVERMLEQQVFSSPYLVYAVQIEGTFTEVTTRVVYGQEKPYPLLKTVTEQQAIFPLKDVEGTMIGYWFPSYVGTTNVPGFHWHFITKDKQSGGHVLSFTSKDARIAVDAKEQWSVVLPPKHVTQHIPASNTKAHDAFKGIE